MSNTSKFYKVITPAIAVIMIFSMFGTAAVSAQNSDGINRQFNAESGKVSFISPEMERVLPASRVLGISRPPQDPGMALAKRFGIEFGLKDPEQELSKIKSDHPGNGRLAVHYQQEYLGVPVLGGELIVNTNEAGDLYSINGEVSPNLSLQTQPDIDPIQATQTALASIAKWYEKTPADFKATEPQLWIFDENLLQPSIRPVELVWRMDVTAKDDGFPLRELVLVNAQRGTISLHFNQIDTIWQPNGTITDTGIKILPNNKFVATLGSPLINTHTANNNSSLPGTFLCNQSQPNCTNGINPQADAAHKYAIGTYNLYATQYQRDSIDNAGKTIVSTVQYCSPDPAVPCPYGNAFWSGSQMVYGSKYGFPLADDVVAHELTHGVTQYESRLLYFYQSGAINESFSDLWGEYYDQTNGLGNDSAGVKWLIGEDVSGLRVIRSMKNPPLYGDPDKMKSSLYQKTSSDNGGVHHNSGINNKAVYLMVDGGSFNNKTVTALGWGKVGAIYYEANTNLLTSGSDYSDLYYALRQACTNLIGQHGIVPADCQEVKDAIDAVQMNAQPSTGFNPDAPLCPNGTVTDPSLTLFKDNLESGMGNWSTSGLAWTVSNKFASSGTSTLWGNDAYPTSDSRVMITTGISIPAGKTFLHFKHAFLLDYFTSKSVTRYYDGGVLEYSIDGGNSWVDAKPLFSTGKNYGPALYSGNLLAGRQAFVGDSHGYVSTRYNLSSLAGKMVNFRWRLATDQAVDLMGWFVDDVQIYTCIPVPPIPTLLAPANDALITNYSAVPLDWSDTLSGLDHYQVQVADENTFAAPIYDANTVVSQYQLPAVTPNTKYYWRVRSLNSLGFSLGWSKVFTFRAAMLPPVLTAPADLAVLTTRRPTLDWDVVPGATGYKVIISANANLSSPIRSASVINSEYTPSSDLPANTVLYWGVRATGPNGPSLLSLKRSFTTGNPPSVPVLLSPANNALVKVYTPFLDWSDSVLPTGTTFKHYELQVDDNSDFSSLVINAATTDGDILASNFTPLADLPSNTKFFWRVRAINDVSGVDHISGWSKVFSFRTVISPPTLLLPTDTSTVASLKPAFSWNAATGSGTIKNYTIQVSTSSVFDVFLINTTSPGSSYTPLTNLPAGKTLYWRVRVNGANGPSAWSAIFSFTTP